MGLRSRRVVNQLLHRWRSALTSEERVQLMDYQHTETGPAEDESFPRLNIAPDLDGYAGPLLECRSEGEMDFGSVSGKLLYRACVKVLNKKKLSGRVDTPWRSVLGFNDDVKPEWRALLCSHLRTSGYTKLGHIVSTGWATVRERTRIRSQRLLDQLAAEIVGSLPAAFQELLNDPTVIDQWREGGQYEFPLLNISAAVEEGQEDERLILSFTTPELGTFELAGKKALYMLCVKVWHAQALAGVPACRWTEYFAWTLFKRGSHGPAVSLYWLLEEPLMGGGRMDIKDSSPGLAHITHSKQFTTLKRLVDTAGPEFKVTRAVAEELSLRSLRYTGVIIKRWTNQLSEDELNLIKEYHNGTETSDRGDPFPELELFFYFFFRLFPSGVATANHLSPPIPIFCILNTCTH
ncbi:hypothetical protein QTP70_023206 [Hemibagrus guttatus]|uniref:Uncharacterized protein n=1 Tax=Hemibagrus guttatus TaxID=175788 RepID=A0AAE0R4L1_9TELE|nr:hypothetical protein QTP70_023206 [Hemibagrus guttatus]